MAEIDLNKFLEFVGISAPEGEELTQDTLHQAFSSKYVSIEKAGDNEDVVKNVTGRRMGSLTTLLKQQSRELGVELPEDKNKFEDQLTHVLNTYQANSSARIQELEQSLEGGQSDEELTKLREQNAALQLKYDDTKSLLDNNTKAFEDYKTEVAAKAKADKLNSVIGKAMSGIQYKNDISEVERAGFDTLVKSKYDFKFDENDTPYIAIKETGKRIPNGEKMGEFLSIADVLQREAQEQKLIAVNPNAEKGNPDERGVKKLGAKVKADLEQEGAQSGRKLASRAANNASA